MKLNSISGSVRQGSGHIALGALHYFRRLGIIKALSAPPEAFRILCFHGTAPVSHHRLLRLLDSLANDGGFVNAHDFCQCLPITGRFLLTFDDGYDNNFAFAEKLAARGISAIYFVVPGFIGRTTAEYMDYHRGRGVEPFIPTDGFGSDRGLSVAEVRQLAAMGHVVGAHNFAHRSLGEAHEQEAAYEIDTGVDALEQMLGQKVSEFALAFGFAKDINPVAIQRLHAQHLRTYTALRGWTRYENQGTLLHRTGINPAMPLTTCLEIALGRIDWATRRECQMVEQLWNNGTSSSPKHGDTHL